MSSSIWTQCAEKSRLSSLSATAWRICEDQSRNATRKLVDSDLEQERLEELLDASKPPYPLGPEWDSLHYLLKTPFRYKPWHSRFRAAADPGVWYGSGSLETAIAETAFQKLRFLNDTEADLQLEVALTGFSVLLRSKRLVDLTSGPFRRFENRISSPTSYRDSQPLASEMRAGGVEVCRYLSCRDPEKGANLAVFQPKAFAQRHVPDSSRETLFCFGNRKKIELSWRRFSGDKSFIFERQ